MSEEDLTLEEAEYKFKSIVCTIAQTKLTDSVEKWLAKNEDYDIPMKELKNMLDMYNIISNEDMCGEVFAEERKKKKLNGYYI